MLKSIDGSFSFGWSEVRRQVESIYCPPVKSVKTWLKMRQAIDLLEAHSSTPEAVSFDVIQAIIQTKVRDGCESITINSLLASIRTVCGIMQTLGTLPVNPFSSKVDLFLRANRSSKRRYLDRGEVRLLLRRVDEEFAAANHPLARFKAGRLRALIYLVAHTGLRSMEALTLRRDDVDDARGFVTVTELDHRTKTAGSAATIPLPRAAVLPVSEWKIENSGRFLFPCLDGDRPWVHGGTGYRPSDMVKAIGERAGVKGATLLALRHTLATHARTYFGFDPPSMRDMLRHSSIRTQDYYVHRDLVNLKTLADRIDFHA